MCTLRRRLGAQAVENGNVLTDFCDKVNQFSVCTEASACTASVRQSSRFSGTHTRRIDSMSRQVERKRTTFKKTWYSLAVWMRAAGG